MALTDKLTAIADAIRAKTGKTDTLTLEEMETAITTMETDSTNFSIMGSATEPANPKENTIWIETDVVIGEYQFSAIQPTSRANGAALQNGDVWIKTAEKSNVTINVLKKNAINENLVAVYQYVNSDWSKKESLIYINNNWTKFGDEIIIPNGTIPLIVEQQANCHITVGTDKITNTTNINNGSTYGSVGTKNKIDVTNYKQMVVVFSSFTASGASARVGISSGGVNNAMGFVKSVYVGSSGAQTVTVDLTDVVGEYTLAVGGGVWAGTITSWKLIV